MTYLYILRLANEQIYVGFTNNLKKRIEEHRSGTVFTTKKYLPVKLVYYEAYLAWEDAKKREKMIKHFGSTYVHLRRRICGSLKQSQGRG